MDTYYCLKCYKNFILKLLDNKNSRKHAHQEQPTICPYCGSKNLGILKKIK